MTIEEKFMFDSFLNLISQVGYSNAFVFSWNDDYWRLSYESKNKKIIEEYAELYELCH